MAGTPSVAFTITAQDLASPVLQKVEGSTRRLGGETGALQAVFGRTDGARKFANALENVAFQSAGVSGNLSTLLQGLSSLAIGSGAMLAVTAGLTAVVGVFSLLKPKVDETKKSIDELVTSLRNEAFTKILPALAYNQIGQRLQGLRETLAGGVVRTTMPGEHGINLPVVRPLTERERANLQSQIASLGADLERLRDRLQSGFTPNKPARSGIAASRGTGFIGPVDWLSILQGMTPGADPTRAQPFRVQAPGAVDLINPSSLHLTPPPELLQRINFQEWAHDFGGEAGGMLTDAFGEGLTAGFTRAFTGEGIGGFFKGLGAAVLAGLGSVFSQVGKAMVAASALFAKLRAALLTLNPFTALAAGVGLIALGSVLGAAASAVGGLDRGRAGGYSSPGGFTSGAYLSSNTMNRPGEVIVNFTGRGPDFTDPEERERFARMISEVGPGGTRQVIFHRTG